MKTVELLKSLFTFHTSVYWYIVPLKQHIMHALTSHHLYPLIPEHKQNLTRFKCSVLNCSVCFFVCYMFGSVVLLLFFLHEKGDNSTIDFVFFIGLFPLDFTCILLVLDSW